ncbi:hypothetical protein [Conservatibacter flavescens]|uniref:Uncharacterized protein n=1 Tax=Conservatibacter flavescens TaxID=28161 RepID=A0A2M8S3E9_9PAST|nr:hypothetical protein [Conservatibacter flavescens]PJG85627.1 hypothetical protein CVP05_05555 [Conservatibacter flavescens]
MDNKINNYRAPMVTAIGFLIGIILLIIALYRILNNRFPEHDEEHYYHNTLKIFMLGIICSFIGTLLAIFQQIFF